jgi:hypothetical protein
MVALGLDELAGVTAVAAVTGVVGIPRDVDPEARVDPKRDVVMLSLDDWVGAAAAGVVGVPVSEGVHIDTDRRVPLVGEVAMVDFSLVESQNPNSVETGEGGVGKMRNHV